jgi:hypothetical protein
VVDHFRAAGQLGQAGRVGRIRGDPVDQLVLGAGAATGDDPDALAALGEQTSDVGTRADEVLCLNVEDLYPQDKRGKITAKGGATEWIHWQSCTTQLLPRLIACRNRGPLFLTDRKAPAEDPPWTSARRRAGAGCPTGEPRRFSRRTPG